MWVRERLNFESMSQVEIIILNYTGVEIDYGVEKYNYEFVNHKKGI